MENPIKMDDLGVPLFLETPISILLHDRVGMGQSESSKLVYMKNVRWTI